jgi:mRNA-degrading endonuclease RelE of RelBE toxin-antitoxin system
VSRRLVWHPQAVRDVSRLPDTEPRRVSAAVDRLQETEEGNIMRPIGRRPREWRLGAGARRVAFTFENRDTLRILRVLQRRKA